MKADILFFYAWDVAYEIPLEAVRRDFSQAGEGTVKSSKAAPRDLPRERFLRLPLETVPAGSLAIEATANLYAFGVVSLTFRYPVEVARLSDLIPHHNPPLDGGLSMDRIARTELDRLFARLGPHLEDPKPSPESAEAYTVFHVSPEDVGLADSTAWLKEHGRDVAALLNGERDPGRLSDDEVAETLRYHYSYYRDDVVIVDWEAALHVDRAASEDVLAVFELANLQLVEYRHYDAVLDRAVTRAYDDVERFYRRPSILRGVGQQLRKLRELRISLAEVAEEVENATKFLGDWHLARLYLGCASRFHLPEWKMSVEEKLRTLDELYNLAATESSNRKMLILESIIVILFIVDLVVLGLVSTR